MQDVILYREDENWIYFVECVTSVGSMDAKHVIEIISVIFIKLYIFQVEQK